MPHHEGATSCASSTREASSLMISVSTSLEAVRLNGQCTIQLDESLVDMVTNLTKEVTHLKNDNMLLKQEIKNLHSLIKASPRPPSQYIHREQRIVPAEMSHKDAASIQRVPRAVYLTSCLLTPYLLGRPRLHCRTGADRDVAAGGI
jgi:hypothetical protein